MKIIGYVRVSTQKQGESGLGLDAQRTAIEAYAKAEGGELVTTFREVESGKRSDRPELAKAVALAKRTRARLVIAKLDRLARNVAFVSSLMESKVDFVACDNPHANRLTLHILAAIAEHEAEAVSQRTKAALAAAKARGVKLGSARPGHWSGREAIQRKAQRAATAAAKVKRDSEAEPVYSEVLPIIHAMREAGDSLQDIADELNGQGFTTIRGAAWGKMQVSRLLAYAGEPEQGNGLSESCN